MFSRGLLIVAALSVMARAGSIEVSAPNNCLMSDSTEPRVRALIRNTGNSAVLVQICKDDTLLPAGWSVMMCTGGTDGLCYPPFIDTVTYTIPAGDSTQLDADFIISEASAAVGFARFVIRNSADTSDCVPLILGVSYQGGQQAADITFAADTTVAALPEGIMTRLTAVVTNNGALRNVHIVKKPVSTPAEWLFSMCALDQCYPPFVDTLTVAAAPSSQTVVDLDITPSGSGSGVILLEAIDGETAAKSAVALYLLSGSSNRIVSRLVPYGSGISAAQFDNRLLLQVPAGMVTARLVDLHGRIISDIYAGKSPIEKNVVCLLPDVAGQFLLLTVVVNGVTTTVPLRGGN